MQWWTDSPIIIAVLVLCLRWMSSLKLGSMEGNMRWASFGSPAARPWYATPRFWSLDLPVLTITLPPGVARAARVSELTKLVPWRAPRGRPASTRTWMESVNPLNRPGMDHWLIPLYFLLIECIPHMHSVFAASWLLHVNLCIQIRGLTKIAHG
jgi:hypothetical protein